MKITIEIPDHWYDEKMSLGLTWRYILGRGMADVRNEDEKRGIHK